MKQAIPREYDELPRARSAALMYVSGYPTNDNGNTYAFVSNHRNEWEVWVVNKNAAENINEYYVHDDGAIDYGVLRSDHYEFFDALVENTMPEMTVQELIDELPVGTDGFVV